MMTRLHFSNGIINGRLISIAITKLNMQLPNQATQMITFRRKICNIDKDSSWILFCLKFNFPNKLVWVNKNSFNSLGPSDTIWRQRSGSTLAQVMACCLTVPSHCQNQFWLIISKVEWHSSKGNLTTDTSAITEIIWKIYFLKCQSNFPVANELLTYTWSDIFCSALSILWHSVLQIWGPCQTHFHLIYFDIAH